MNKQKRKPVGILLTVILIAALLTICLELGLIYLHPNTPGSLLKHLIHFAIMFVLLGSSVLLCLFCPPFKKLWAWIDEHILTQETRPIAIDIIYAVIAGLMLLHHFYVILYYPTIPAGATKFAPLWIVFAMLSVFLSKHWQKISFPLVSLFLIFTFERLYTKWLFIINNTNTIYFVSGIYAFFICFNVFSALKPTLWKLFLKTLCSLWTIASLFICIVSLYSAWTGNQIENFAGSTVYLFEGRLSIFSVPTITSSILGCGCIMALIAFTLSKHTPVKILLLFSVLVCIITNSLTDSRSSFMTLSIMMAGMIGLCFWTKYRNQSTGKHSGKQTALIIFSLSLCCGICFFAFVEGQRFLGPKFVEIRNNGGIFPSAGAEEPTTPPYESAISTEPLQFEQRDVWFSENSDINETLHGRLQIWKNGLEHIQLNPYVLIYGKSIDGSVGPNIGRPDHSHNILLQTLLEGGIPALLLYLSLIFYGVFHAFRLWNRKGIPFWQRILPLPVFSILLWEMAECLTHFSYGHPPMTLFWFFLGATITVSKSLGKAPKATEQPAIPAESAITETGE